MTTPTSENRKVASAVAKRGMLALIERRHSYTFLYGAHRGYVGYTPAKVESVTRDGIAKAVVLADGRRMQRRDWSFIEIDSGGLVADVDGVLAQLTEPGGLAIEYREKAEALAAIKRAGNLKIGSVHV